MPVFAQSDISPSTWCLSLHSLTSLSTWCLSAQSDTSPSTWCLSLHSLTSLSTWRLSLCSLTSICLMHVLEQSCLSISQTTDHAWSDICLSAWHLSLHGLTSLSAWYLSLFFFFAPQSDVSLHQSDDCFCTGQHFPHVWCHSIGLTSFHQPDIYPFTVQHLSISLDISPSVRHPSCTVWHLQQLLGVGQCNAGHVCWCSSYRIGINVNWQTLVQQLHSVKKKKRSADTHVDATATDLVERSADTGCCNRYRLIKMGQLTYWYNHYKLGRKVSWHTCWYNHYRLGRKVNWHTSWYNHYRLGRKVTQCTSWYNHYRRSRKINRHMLVQPLRAQ